MGQTYATLRFAPERGVILTTDMYMNQTIIKAIDTKHILRLEYHGYYRLVEPHTYGVNKKDHETLSCYQIEGGSESKEQQGWKLLLVHEAHAISMIDTVFQGARNGYKRDTKTMKRIYAQL